MAANRQDKATYFVRKAMHRLGHASLVLSQWVRTDAYISVVLFCSVSQAWGILLTAGTRDSLSEMHWVRAAQPLAPATCLCHLVHSMPHDVWST